MRYQAIKGQFTNYSPALLALLFTVLVLFMLLSNMVIGPLKQEIEEQNNRVHAAQAIETKLGMQKEKNRVQLEKVREYRTYQDAWAPRIATYNNTASVLNRMSMLAEQDNHLTVGNRDQKDIKSKGQTVTEITYEVTGALSDIMNWLTQVEGDIDYIRHYSSTWEPQANNQVFVKIVFYMNFKIINP